MEAALEVNAKLLLPLITPAIEKTLTLMTMRKLKAFSAVQHDRLKRKGTKEGGET